MKKNLYLFFALLIASLSFAQGGGFNYKALITDNGNVLATHLVTFKFTVLENGTTSVYQETQATTTDANGIVAVNVGEGSVVSGNFTTIDWGSSSYFLKVEIDTGSGYHDFGTTEFKAVPYAKFANRVEIADNIQGIPVSSTSPDNGQVLKYNGIQFVPADDDTSGGSGTDGVVNSAAFSGTSTKTLTLARSNGLGNITANFTDNDTQLTDAQIGTMGYIKNANDADHSTTNEIQHISKNGSTITLSNGGGSVTDTDTDTHLTDAQIGAMGYIKNANDADHSATNEIQTLSVNSNQLSISQGNTVTLPAGVTKLDDLSDAKSDSDGTNNGSSIFIGVDAGANDDQSDNQNIGVGYQTLYSNTTGSNNTASGYKALSWNTTGYNNTASGNRALNGNTTGYSNTATGHNSLFNNTTGYQNAANGNESLYSNTIGYKNTANGNNALHSNRRGYGNTANGNNALYSNAYGSSNVAIGASALCKDTNHSNLVAVGDSALFHNGLGPLVYGHSWKNTALGSKALYSNNIGSYNTAGGFQTLYSNTSGNYNTAYGQLALYSNTTGDNNVANGNEALYSNTTGFSNVAIGVKALYNNTDKSRLVAVGDSALYNNGTGATQPYEAQNNTALGTKALYSNTIGYKNTASGHTALYSNTTGGNNTASGHKSLNNNTTGNSNTANGNKALYSNTTGFSNVAIGTSALYKNTNRNNLVAVGDSALYNNGTGATAYSDAKYNTALGSKALYSNTIGYNNTASGYKALNGNTTGYSNTASGNRALNGNTTGYGNTATGHNSLYNNTTGYQNAANGNESLYSNTIGYKNTANGNNALHSNRRGYGNTANGNNALYSNTYGNSNVAIGVSALYNNTNHSNLVAVGDSALFHNGLGPLVYGRSWKNTALGSKALYSNNIGSYNTAGGFQTLYSNTSGNYNTAYGQLALYSNTTGDNNSANGNNTLYSNTTGNSNTAFGQGAGYSNQTGDANIFLGHNAGYNETGSNKLYIENSDSATPLIGGDFSTDQVTINGDLEITQNIQGKIKAAESGDADMKAYLYGFINNNVIKTASSTDGFTFTKNATGDYTITFNTSMGSYSRYIVIATLNSGLPRIITTLNYPDHFNVDIFNLSGIRVDDNFKFVVYKK